MTGTKPSVAIIGSGSWGTSIAIHLAQYCPEVILWGRDESQTKLMEKNRENTKYLPGFTFPKNLRVTHDFAEVNNTKLPIIAVPSHAFFDIFNRLTHNPQGIAWITKGIDHHTHELFSTLILEKWGKHTPMAMITGPSFAKEVTEGLPTALTVAGTHEVFNQNIQKLFHHHSVRAYIIHDLIGAQIGGTIKNVLAIAAGISEGLNLGKNARAALITRGLSEMSRLGIALGGEAGTFTGLAGLGDLVLTATDPESRNYRFGVLIGQGKSATEAKKIIKQVVEGADNAAHVVALSKKMNTELPICTAVYDILYHGLAPKDALMRLMERPAQYER